MHVITRKRLNEFAEKYPEIRTALANWYDLVVGKLTVFNVGGNKVRLVAAIHYNRKRIYIRGVLTHEE